jgi:glycosyltransferase involved in cell wall biosynthesis
MKVLVLTSTYPSSEQIYAMGFIHARIKYYQKNGIEVSFSCKAPYSYDGVNIFPNSSLIEASKYDAIIAHAPNLKHHIRFLLPKINQIKKLFFIFHGHEVLHLNRYAPDPFPLLKSKSYFLKKIIRQIYDSIKIFIMRKFIASNINKNLRLIFVSKWLYRNFLVNVKIPSAQIEKRFNIIHNCASEFFIATKHNPTNAKYDFICIRPYDESRCGIDIIVKLAEQNPNLSFHVYGQGKYFEVYKKPINVTVFSHYVPNDKIPELLNNYRAALMPTRQDSQGVMVSEMLTYGMPVITSDILVAKQMFKDFPNAFFISNLDPYLPDLKHVCESIKNKVIPNKFHTSNTVDKEVKYIKS